MKTIKYYNPKTTKYQISKVLSIEDDIVLCLNVKANYQYQESLSRLKELENAQNPDWSHKTIKKPLVILK